MIDSQILRQVADELQENMSADEFRNYTLGLVIYKQLSRRMEQYGNKILKQRDFNFTDLDESKSTDYKILEVIKKNALKEINYYISPAELFDTVATCGTEPGAALLADLTKILVEMNTAPDKSPDDLFANLEIDMGNTEETKTDLINGIMDSLAKIEKSLQDAEDNP